MAEAKVEIKNNNVDKCIQGMHTAVTKALEAIGLAAEGYAKKDTPVDTGRLRNSMSHKVQGDSVYIGTNVEYGIYVEEGARGRQGHHMLKNAATNHSSEYQAIINAALKS